MNAYVSQSTSRWELYFGVLRSQRYHRKRQGFFELLNNGMQILTAAAGTAAFIAVKDTMPAAAAWLSLFVAFLSVVSLVMKPSERARKHADLHDKFSDLAQAISVPKDLGELDVHALMCKRLDIEKQEPKHSRALNEVCYDETAQALGLREQAHASRFQRAFAHVLP